MGVPTRIVEGFLPGTRRSATPAIETDPVQQRPRLGRGLLPGLTAGSCSTRPAATCRRSRRCRPASPVASTGPIRRPAARCDARARIDAGATRAAGAAGRSTRRARALGSARRGRLLLLLIVGARWRSSPGSADREVGRRADGAYGTVTRIASRLRVRAAADADRLRVRRRPRRGPARRPSRARDGRPRQGRVGLRPRDPRRGADRTACAPAQRRLRVSLLRLAFRRKERRGTAAD